MMMTTMIWNKSAVLSQEAVNSGKKKDIFVQIKALEVPHNA
jgi:hypothetical protein